MASRPPFCPNPACPRHRAIECRGRWFVRRGTHPNRHLGAVQRFGCRTCGKTFSTRTFSVQFATRRHLDLKRLTCGINAGAGIRALGREFGVSEKVILNRIARLARQAMGLHAELRQLLRLGEDLAADGFESFVGSQYWPNSFLLLVGSQSQYLYGLEYAQLRRKGRMSAAQRRRRDRLNRELLLPRGQTERAFARILSEVRELGSRSVPGHRPLTLWTDRHRSYRRAIEEDRTSAGWQRSGGFVHRQIPSTRPRTRSNPLFSVNYFDREIRKDQACHVRETVQWSRDVNAAMDRMWLYGVWHNCFKRWRIRGADPRTHAELAGVPGCRLAELKSRFFSRRYFFSHLSLTDSLWRSWLRGWPTPLKRSAPAVPAYALA